MVTYGKAALIGSLDCAPVAADASSPFAAAAPGALAAPLGVALVWLGLKALLLSVILELSK